MAGIEVFNLMLVINILSMLKEACLEKTWNAGINDDLGTGIDLEAGMSSAITAAAKARSINSISSKDF
jgi:hypothetical protein